MICDSANSLHYHRFFFSMLRRLPEPPLFPSPPSFGPLPPMSNPFFRPWSAATRQPNSVDRTVHQRGSQLPAPPSNRLFIDAGDFKQDSVGTVPKPLRLHGQIPTPLLLIQPTQQQIHVPVVLTARMGFIPRARAAPTFMNLSWHTSVSSPSPRMPALYATRPLDRKPPN